MSDTPPIKHPISFEEARAFAEEYFDAPNDVHMAEFNARCEFASVRGPEDAPKLETARRIHVAMNQLTARMQCIIDGGSSIRDGIEYLDPERKPS